MKTTPDRITAEDVSKNIGQFYETYAVPADSFVRKILEEAINRKCLRRLDLEEETLF